MKKQIKLSKEKLEKLVEALKKKNKKTEKQEIIEEKTGNFFNHSSLGKSQMKENKFIESGIALEKISPVLKPVAKVQEGLEQISSLFLLQRKPENQTIEKPYESGEQKYFSQSGEYKTLGRIQSENLQTPTGVEKNMVHMGTEQATKRKSERFFDEEQEKKYSADIRPLEEVRKREKKMYTSR